MQTPEEVAAMLRLKALGWGIRRIAKELGCSHMTVRRYLAEGGWVAYRGRGRPRTLAGHEEWVAERFRLHAGNADVEAANRFAEGAGLGTERVGTGMTRSLPRWANRQPPARAAASLVRALRDARRALLFATWTSHPAPGLGAAI